MAITNDNQFSQQDAGQADWDSGLADNFTTLDRGFHTVMPAGMTIRTGDILVVTTSGYWMAYNSRSASNKPRAASFLAAASGDQLQAILHGIVRSVYNVASSPGWDYYVNTADPGAVIRSDVATPGKQIGFSVTGGALVFRPAI